MPTLTFLQDHLTLNVKSETEFTTLSQLYSSFPIKFGCRDGKCGTCAIHVIKGEENLSPKTRQEKETLCRLHLNSHRLACQCAILGNVVIDKD